MCLVEYFQNILVTDQDHFWNTTQTHPPGCVVSKLFDEQISHKTTHKGFPRNSDVPPCLYFLPYTVLRVEIVLGNYFCLGIRRIRCQKGQFLFIPSIFLATKLFSFYYLQMSVDPSDPYFVNGEVFQNAKDMACDFKY